MLKQFDGEIEGVPPIDSERGGIMWNRLSRGLMLLTDSINRKDIDAWWEENWWRKALIENNGINVFDPKTKKKDVDDHDVLMSEEWIKNMTIQSAQNTGLNPHFAKTKKETYTKHVKTYHYKVNESVCKVRDLVSFGAYVKNGDKAVWTVRPNLKKWSVKFSIIDPMGRMKLKELKGLLEYAGIINGIGSGRTLGCFGRFTVKNLEGKEVTLEEIIGE